MTCFIPRVAGRKPCSAAKDFKLSYVRRSVGKPTLPETPLRRTSASAGSKKGYSHGHPVQAARFWNVFVTRPARRDGGEALAERAGGLSPFYLDDSLG